jgi:hypothetical protein
MTKPKPVETYVTDEFAAALFLSSRFDCLGGRCHRERIERCETPADFAQDSRMQPAALGLPFAPLLPANSW